MKKLTIGLFVVLQFAMLGCSKQSNEDSIEGVWVIEHPLGYDLSGIPADTLVFTRKNNTNVMILNLKGAAPASQNYIETPYKFINGRLEFIDYANPGYGYIPADSFKWINKGSKFEVILCQVNLYMNACYEVFYNRIGSAAGR